MMPSPSEQQAKYFPKKTMRQNCLYLEFPWFIFCIANPRIYSKCGKIRPRKTPNTDSFYALYQKVSSKNSNNFWSSKLMLLEKHYGTKY